MILQLAGYFKILEKDGETIGKIGMILRRQEAASTEVIEGKVEE